MFAIVRIRPYIISGLALLLDRSFAARIDRADIAGTRPAAELVGSFDGLGAGLFAVSTPRNPSDNSLAVGPDHIIQTVTPDADALTIIRAGIDHVVGVTDDEVEDAMRALFTDTHNVVEGAASLAAVLQERATLRGHTAAIVLTGANVDPRPFAGILREP
jgi:pyridoxal-phosphate dependent enzyme